MFSKHWSNPSEFESMGVYYKPVSQPLPNERIFINCKVLYQFHCSLAKKDDLMIYKNVVGKHFEILSFLFPLTPHKSF